MTAMPTTPPLACSFQALHARHWCCINSCACHEVAARQQAVLPRRRVAASVSLALHSMPRYQEGDFVLTGLVGAAVFASACRLRLLGRGLVSKAATTTARSYLMDNIPDLKLD